MRHEIDVVIRRFGARPDEAGGAHAPRHRLGVRARDAAERAQLMPRLWLHRVRQLRGRPSLAVEAGVQKTQAEVGKVNADAKKAEHDARAPFPSATPKPAGGGSSSSSAKKK